MATQKEEILITLEFDEGDAKKRSAELNQNIKELTASQKALKKEGKEGSQQFVENAKSLRANKKELSETNKTIDNLTKANKANAGSNDQLKAQLSLLTAQYNKLSAEERDAGESGIKLNAQINEITETLKGNEEAVGDNRRSVGDYGSALEGTPFDGFVGGIKGIGAAFTANPIGLILTAIVGALALLKKAFTRSEEGSNKFAKAQAALGGIFTVFLDVLDDVAKFLVSLFENPKKAIKDFANLIKDNIVNRFEGLLELIPQLGKAVGQLFSGDFGGAAETAANAVAKVSLGVEDISGKIKGAGDAIGKFASDAAKAAAESAKLADAEGELVKQQREVELIQLESLKNAEKQRQVRDDTSRSIQERIEANKTLGNILVEQSKKELAIANEALRIEEERIRLNGETTENLDSRAEALTAIAEINERITGQQSEQLVNEVGLQQEAEDARAEAAAKRAERVQKQIEDDKLLIDLFIAQQGIKAKTFEEEIKLAEEVSEQKKEILQRELDAKIISETEYQIQVLALDQELAQKRAEAAVDNADRELQAFIESNQSKIDANEFLNDEILAQEQVRLEKEAQARRDFEQTRLDEGVINQQEYNDAINAVNAENEEANKELLAQKAEADKEQALVDAENQRAVDDLNRVNQFEQRQVDLDRAREQELANAEKTGADTQLINEKFAKFEEELEKQKNLAKLQAASSTFGNLAAIAGEQSNIGKGFAVAQTLVDTYAAAQAAYLSQAAIPVVGPALGGIAAAAAVAGGLKNVQKISGIKFAKGGVFGGKAHSEGGTKGYFDDGTQVEVEKGELFAVVNKTNTSMLNKLSSLNQHGGNGDSYFERGGTKSFLQDGGIGVANIGGSVESDNSSADQLLNAIESMPAPVVAVQDINEVQSDTKQVEARSIV
jgi:hypothetical protein